MEGTAIAGIVTGIGGSITAIATAFINRGTAEGVKEIKAELLKLTAPDGEIAQLKKRVTTVEGAIATAATIANLPAEVAGLRTHIESQLRAAKAEWEDWKRRQQRAATASQPALVDDEARREAGDASRHADDAIRRIESLERELKESRSGIIDLQLMVERVSTKLDLLLGGNINLGGKSR